MRKSIKKLGLAIAIACFGVNFSMIGSAPEIVKAETVVNEENGFQYEEKDDGTIAITNYSGKDTDITIPDAINGKKVTELGVNAVSYYSRIKEINIPQSVRKINFSDSFGNIAFYDSNLIDINVSEGNSSYASRDGILYNKEKTKLLRCPPGKEGMINIPEGVEKIAEYAFMGCGRLTSINIPEGVKEIGTKAFTYCSNLTEINIPESIKIIDFSYSREHGIFSGCSNLENINVDEGNNIYASQEGIIYNKEKTKLLKCPEGKKGSINILEGVNEIGRNAFDVCSSITEINIPDGVTKIDEFAFSSCGSLTEIDLPEKLTEISAYIFYFCMNLKRINIPEGVTKIDLNAFYGCNNLSEINISESNSNYSSQDGILYNKEKTELIRCPEGKKGLNIPGGVTSIGDIAFSGCNSLARINIPEGITYIGYNTFRECNNLTIYGEENSYAQSYAKGHNIPFKLSSEYEKDINNDSTTTVNKYTVKFINYDGSQIGDIQEVEEGKAAVAPTVEVREGYTFKGWDKDYSNVKSNLEVKAIYEENKQSQGENTNQGENQNQGGQTANSGDIANSGIIAIMILGLAGTIVFKKKHIS